ncbi:MAG: AAA family ATPase [Planctomycetaceae bacterium]
MTCSRFSDDAVGDAPVREGVDSSPAEPLFTNGPVRRCRSFSLASPHAGVGKSVLSWNLAMALARQGHSVCLLDASSDLSPLPFRVGLSSAGHLAQVLTGRNTRPELVAHGPAGLRVIRGAAALLHLTHCPAGRQESVAEQFLSLEDQCDFLILDTGPALAARVPTLAVATDAVCLVATPEHGIVADTIHAIRTLRAKRPGLLPRLILNEVDSPEQARQILARVQESAQFDLDCRVRGIGYIPYDQAVSQAVTRQRTLFSDSSHSPAAQAMDQIACRLAATLSPLSPSPSSLSFCVPAVMSSVA